MIPENQRVTIVERLQDISINFPSPEFTKLNKLNISNKALENNNENKNEKSINLSNIPREVLERRNVKGLGLEIKEEMYKVKFLDRVFNNASINSMINKTYKDNGNQTDVRIDLK